MVKKIEIPCECLHIQEMTSTSTSRWLRGATDDRGYLELGGRRDGRLFLQPLFTAPPVVMETPTPSVFNGLN